MLLPCHWLLQLHWQCDCLHGLLQTQELPLFILSSQPVTVPKPQFPLFAFLCIIGLLKHKLPCAVTQCQNQVWLVYPCNPVQNLSGLHAAFNSYAM